MSVCRYDDSPWCYEGTCKECDAARKALARDPITERANYLNLISEALSVFSLTTESSNIEDELERVIMLLREVKEERDSLQKQLVDAKAASKRAWQVFARAGR